MGKGLNEIEMLTGRITSTNTESLACTRVPFSGDPIWTSCAVEVTHKQMKIKKKVIRLVKDSEGIVGVVGNDNLVLDDVIIP